MRPGHLEQRLGELGQIVVEALADRARQVRHALQHALHVWVGLTFSPNYRGPMCFVDEGYRLYPALRLMEGQQLFRDMFTAYPPLSYYLHKWAFELLGTKLSSVRIVLIAPFILDNVRCTFYHVQCTQINVRRT